MQQDPKQLAGGDLESEMIARIIPAAMQLNVDPVAAIQTYINQGKARATAKKYQENK
jgi:hypothetical protein